MPFWIVGRGRPASNAQPRTPGKEYTFFLPQGQVTPPNGVAYAPESFGEVGPLS